jgi:hypothetical protein
MLGQIVAGKKDNRSQPRSGLISGCNRSGTVPESDRPQKNRSVSVQSGFCLIWEFTGPVAVAVASFGRQKTGPDRTFKHYVKVRGDRIFSMTNNGIIQDVILLPYFSCTVLLDNMALEPNKTQLTPRPRLMVIKKHRQSALAQIPIYRVRTCFIL